ncbi:hypothetical protein [Celeribacter halophilus]|uniref:hypothetical protein n=1 Tax=Celeribacter halophilus TaxID=576117 RepID=UPI003A911563
MARDLTSEELAILQTHAAAGGRIAYYTALQSFDNDYAGLSRSGLAASRHTKLELAGFGATNRMTGSSHSKTFVPGAT